MRIRRRRSKKRYLGEKRVYEHERFSVDFPAKFRGVVEPFLNKDLDVDVRRDCDDELVVILRSMGFYPSSA